MDGSFFFNFKIMFKQNDIVVNFKYNYQITKIGSIYKLERDECRNQIHGIGGYKNGSNDVNSKDFRLATPLEIIAYNQGIRNINDIKNLNYEIY